MIGILLVYGYRTRLTSAGWTARHCRRCGKAQPFECFNEFRSEHIYYIHGREREIGLILACDFCETTTALPAGGGEAKSLVITRRWRRADGLRALVEQTNPALGPVADSAEPTRQELCALLESANSQSNAANVNVQPGMVLGGILGALGLGALAGGLSALGLPLVGLDTFGHAALGLTLGAVGGAIAGALREQRRAGREVVTRVLRDALARHGLSLGLLRRALAEHPRGLGRVAHGLRTLAAELGETDGAAGAQRRGARRNVCAECRLVNFESGPACRRCGAALRPSAA